MGCALPKDIVNSSCVETELDLFIFHLEWIGVYKKKRVRVELLINSRTEYAGCNLQIILAVSPILFMVVCEMVEKLPGSYSYNH